MKMNSLKISALVVFVSCAAQSAFAEGTTTGFSAIDTDVDGYISTTEAATADSNLNAQWKKLDKDKNGKLDKSEFSAFETMHERATKAPTLEPAK